MLKLQVLLVPPSAQSQGLGHSQQVFNQQQPGFQQQQQQPPQLFQQGSFGLNGSSTPFVNIPSSTGSSPFPNGLAKTVDTSYRIKKFLHITASSNTLQEMCGEIQERFLRLYPDEEPLSIFKIQDADECDLDPDYTVSMVFDTQNIVRVLLDEEFTTAASIGSKRRLATELSNAMKRRKIDSANSSGTSIWVRSVSLPSKKTHPLKSVLSATPIGESFDVEDELEENDVSLHIQDDSANNTVLIDPKKARSLRTASQIMGSPKRITSGMLRPQSQPDLSKNEETDDTPEDMEDEISTDDNSDGYQSANENEAENTLDIKKRRASVPTKADAIIRRASASARKTSFANTTGTHVFNNTQILQTPTISNFKRNASLSLATPLNSTTYLAQATPDIIKEAERITPALPRTAASATTATSSSSSGFAIPTSRPMTAPIFGTSTSKPPSIPITSTPAPSTNTYCVSEE
ncbi:unnamed protein product [Ambrosiozyma monospora]|uniref:Unnamed protein product n=1 Tax=Ambrosiozyma monospora TaxID=43982 RepID=A0ACB5TUR8_AMBMO|nr:unnamed protein product [Ambrosiozyma monospora]